MISYPRKFGKLSGKIIGAAIEVHKDIGPGFTENIYHNAMKKELKLRSLSFETEKDLRIYYKDDEMGNYRVDLIVESEIVVELKAVEAISKVHVSQVIAYLKASRLKLGLILNF